jgi:hypothetical protein
MRALHGCSLPGLGYGCFLVTLALSGAAYAQDGTARPPGAFQRGELAIGAVITPALEGGGPWFMPAIRLSAPLGAKHAIDLDAGRIYGGNSKYGEIERFYGAQIRFLRSELRSEAARGYWLAGALSLPITKLDGKGNFVGRKSTTLMTVGRGWDQLILSGSRLTGETGVSLGDGLIFYVRAGVQWRPFHKGLGASRLGRGRLAVARR